MTHELKRVLGPIDATCVVIGAIIGVGIFFTPRQVADLAGSANLAMAAWAVGGLIAILGALTFAELGSMYGRAGAQYEILRDGFGTATGFYFVFCNATAIQAGVIGIIATICAYNIGLAAGVELSDARLTLIAVLLIVGLVGANLIGVRWGSRIQNLTVAVKIITLMGVTSIALFTEPTAPAAAAAPLAKGGTLAFAAALVPAFFAYGGWQHALWVGGEVREPGRNVPRAMVVGVGVVVALYLAVNWAYLHLLGYDGLRTSGSPASDATAAAFAGVAARLIGGAVALSAFGVLNAQFLSGPRLIYGLARDGKFFRSFARVRASGAPAPAIVLLGTMSLVLLFVDVDVLLVGLVFIDGVFFVLTGLSLFVLRRIRPDADRPVRVPLFVPVLFVVGEAAIVTGACVAEGWKVPVVGSIWIAAAAVLYALVFRRS